MNMMPMIDMGWGAVLFLLGIPALAIAALLTIVVEAYMINRYLWVPAWKAVVEAITMNLVSGILGYAVVIFIAPWVANGEFMGAGYYVPTRSAVLAALFVMIGPMCVISILVEGVVLGTMEKETSLQQVWKTALIGNLVSYIGLFVIGIAFVGSWVE